MAAPAILKLENFIPDLSSPQSTTTAYVKRECIEAVLDDNTIIISGSRYGVVAGDTARLKKLLGIDQPG